MPTSSPELARELALLDTLTVNDLRAYHLRFFHEPTASRHKTWLVRRIAWRLQADAEGGLSERAITRAAELAKEAEIRVTAPRVASKLDAAKTKVIALPPNRNAGLAPGTHLSRDWRGKRIFVTVLPDGFDYEGTVYRSLSAIARTITGTQWNGFVFFGLKPARPAKGTA